MAAIVRGDLGSRTVGGGAAPRPGARWSTLAQLRWQLQAVLQRNKDQDRTADLGTSAKVITREEGVRGRLYRGFSGSVDLWLDRKKKTITPA